MVSLVIFLCLFICFFVWYLKYNGETSPSREYHSVDALVPAFNEEACVGFTIRDLVNNRYVRKIICINDGSNDNTALILNNLQKEFPDKIMAIHQKNTGKAQAMNKGLEYIETPFVFTTDADTRIPDDEGIGYLISRLRKGASAVGGVCASNLSCVGILPKIIASIKIPIIILKRCAMEIIGGSPFLVSGGCGLYRTDVLKKLGVPSRTQVEDLDLTWSLIENNYKISQSARCVVFTQECNNLRDELKGWKRWIVGYAVCMKLHKKLMLSRFGVGVVLPGMLIPVCSAIFLLYTFFSIILFYVSYFTYSVWWLPFEKTFKEGPFPSWIIFSSWWVLVLVVLSSYSAKIQKRWDIVLYSPLSISILMIALYTWLGYGLPALITGKESNRNKPVRY